MHKIAFCQSIYHKTGLYSGDMGIMVVKLTEVVIPNKLKDKVGNSCEWTLILERTKNAAKYKTIIINHTL